MKLCSHCNAQFSEEHSRCIHCGRRLEGSSERSARDSPDLSRLHHLTDDHPAKIAPLLDRLTEAGISFTLLTDSGTRSVDWYRGSSGWKARASVYVEPGDREVAERLHREFLEDLIPHLAEMGPGAGPSAGSCPACREPLPSAAEHCPSCGLVFPDA
jgi:hypothetical protein